MGARKDSFESLAVKDRNIGRESEREIEWERDRECGDKESVGGEVEDTEVEDGTEKETKGDCTADDKEVEEEDEDEVTGDGVVSNSTKWLGEIIGRWLHERR